ncbi:hypothetical protein BDZ89DRAFT_1148117 [Hymenopellis radicata]|nr:hypothetical protein BDZ89DRAFT_1148117 [Hymenopellis radicata]
MPSFAQTVPVVLLVVASAFAAPAYVPGEADPQALSVFKRNKIACSNDKYSDKCDMDVVRRYNVLELALSKRLSVFKPTAPVESDDAHAEHVGKNATSPSARMPTARPTLRAPVSASLSRLAPCNSVLPLPMRKRPSSLAASGVTIQSTGTSNRLISPSLTTSSRMLATTSSPSDMPVDKTSVSSSTKPLNAPDQIWTVQCDTCSTGISGIHGKKVASQCIIRPHAHKGGCVAVGPNPDSLAYVTNSAGCTKFDFFTN